MFVEANPAEAALGFANLNRYFSTLDGYGQRSKHQLLLERALLSTGAPNRLLDVLRHRTTAHTRSSRSAPQPPRRRHH